MLTPAGATTHHQSYKLLNFEISNEVFRGPVAASCLGGLLVLLFNILSCAILIK